MTPYQTIHQKSICNHPKESYNLAEREPFATSDWLSPEPTLHVRDSSQGFISLKWKPMRLAVAEADGFLFTGKGMGALKIAVNSPGLRTMATACRHPKVRIVSRHEDTEYVECLECGEVFDSEEFRDMEIEDTAGTEDLQDDS